MADRSGIEWTDATWNPVTGWGVKPYFADETLTLLLGSARTVLPSLEAGSVDCVVTSPPYYGLRDYEGNPDQIGLEPSPAQYVEALSDVFDEVRRVLADDGTCWLNLGDCYVSQGGAAGALGATGLEGTHPRTRPEADVPHVHGRWNRRWDRPSKNLVGIPWRVAFALQDAGWYLRNSIVWHKTNAMPESVRDRLATRHELLFLLTKSKRYWFDLDAIRVPFADATLAHAPRREFARKDAAASYRGGNPPTGLDRPATEEQQAAGRNPGDVWSFPAGKLADAHHAAFPIELPSRCIAAGCRPGGTVLDPFSGAGTTSLAAQQLGRRAIGIDINAKYHDIALRRMADAPLPFEPMGAPNQGGGQ